MIMGPSDYKLEDTKYVVLVLENNVTTEQYTTNSEEKLQSFLRNWSFGKVAEFGEDISSSNSAAVEIKDIVLKVKSLLDQIIVIANDVQTGSKKSAVLTKPNRTSWGASFGSIDMLVFRDENYVPAPVSLFNQQLGKS